MVEVFGVEGRVGSRFEVEGRGIARRGIAGRGGIVRRGIAIARGSVAVRGLVLVG
jgi:hypothetical protein